VDASPPAVGYKFPDDNPSPGGAVAAKAIGQQCAGVVSDADIRELDQYLAKAAGELAATQDAQQNRVNGRPFLDVLVGDLTATYTK
jgi:hypothetical protein